MASAVVNDGVDGGAYRIIGVRKRLANRIGLIFGVVSDENVSSRGGLLGTW